MTNDEYQKRCSCIAMPALIHGGWLSYSSDLYGFIWLEPDRIYFLLSRLRDWVWFSVIKDPADRGCLMRDGCRSSLCLKQYDGVCCTDSALIYVLGTQTRLSQMSVPAENLVNIIGSVDLLLYNEGCLRIILDPS
jgi:hypothetical protein